MKNTDIFAQGFDIVASISEQALNQSLALLTDPDVEEINTQIIFSFQAPMTNTQGIREVPFFEFYDTFDQVPMVTDPASGKPVPKYSTINVKWTPWLTMVAPLTEDTRPHQVQLLLYFNSGQAWPANSITSFDVASWRWTVNIDLSTQLITTANLTSIETTVPGGVLAMLSSLAKDGSTVLDVFIDFSSEWNWASGDGNIQAGPGSEENTFSLAVVEAYFLCLQGNPEKNPFHFGFEVAPGAQTRTDGAIIPKSLKPWSCTFSLYQDSQQNYSTYNFLLQSVQARPVSPDTAPVTVQGPVPPQQRLPPPYPGRFDTNWITPGGPYDAKILYSSWAFLESMIVGPFTTEYARQLLGNGATLPFAGRLIPDEPVLPLTLFQFTQMHGQPALSITWASSPDGTINLSFSCNFTYTDKITSTGNWTANIILTYAVSNDDPVYEIGTQSQIIPDALHEMPYNTQDMINAAFAAVTNPVSYNGSPTIPLSNMFVLPGGNMLFPKNISLLPEGHLSMDAVAKSTMPRVRPPLPLPSSNASIPTSATQAAQPMAITSDATRTIPALSTSKVNVKPGNPIPAGVSNNTRSSKDIQDPVPQVSANGVPMVDIIQITTVTQDTLDFTISCELMQNSKTSMPVSANSDLIVIQDATGRPMVFTVGADSRFYLLVGINGTAGNGWDVIDLLGGANNPPGLDMNVVAFDVTQEASTGLICIAWAMRPLNGGDLQVYYLVNSPNLLTAAPVASLSEIPQGSFDYQWTWLSAVPITGFDPTLQVETLHIGASNPGGRRTLIIEGSKGSDQSHALYEYGNSDTAAALMELPEEISPGSANFLAYCTGITFGYPTTYFLYKVGQEQRLMGMYRNESTPNQPAVVNKLSSLTWDYSPAVQVKDVGVLSCIATAVDPTRASLTNPQQLGGYTDLYFGGQVGICRIPDGQMDRRELVAWATSVGNVVSLKTTTTADGKVVLWALNDQNLLYYISGQRQDMPIAATLTTTFAAAPAPNSIAWSLPVLFARGVAHCALISSPYWTTNFIYVLMQDKSLVHYWQDPLSTMWRSDLAAGPPSSSLVPKTQITYFQSYTTHIHIEKGGLPFAGVTVNITASEVLYGIVNNTTCAIGTDVTGQLSIAPDPMGNITVIGTAMDLAPPVLHIQSSSFVDTINIYPNGKINSKLKSVQSGSDLQSAKDQQGNPVLTAGTDPNVANGVATNVSTIHGISNDQIGPAQGSNTFVVLEPPISVTDESTTLAQMGIRHSLNTIIVPPVTTQIPAGLVMGLYTVSGQWKMGSPPTTLVRSTPDLTNKLKSTSLSLSLGDIGGALDGALNAAANGVENAAGTVAGDTGSLWQHLETSVVGGVSTLADGTSFLINKLDSGVLQFVVNLDDQLMEFELSTLLQTFKALSFLFSLVGIDIGAILRWLGHLLGWSDIWTTYKTIAGAVKNITSYAENALPGYFDTIKSNIHDEFTNLKSNFGNLLQGTGLTETNTAPPPTKYVVQNNSPQGNFAYYHYSNDVTADSGSSASAPSSETPSTTVPSGQDPLLSLMTDALQTAAQNIISQVGSDGSILINVVKTGSKSDLIKLISSILDIILDSVEGMIDGLLTIAQDLFTSLPTFFEESLEMPLIEALFDAGMLLGEGVDNQDFNVLNALSFVAAIAIVIALDIAGMAPLVSFSNNCDTDTAFFTDLEQTIKNWFTQSASGGAGSAATDSVTGGQRPPPPSTGGDGSSTPTSSDVDRTQQYSVFAGALAALSNLLSTYTGLAEWKGAGKNRLKLSFLTAWLSMAFSFPIRSDGEDHHTWVVRVAAWAIGGVTNLATTAPSYTEIDTIDNVFNGWRGCVSLLVQLPVFGMAIYVDYEEGVDPVEWSADMMSCLGGCVSAIGQITDNMPTKGVGVGITAAASCLSWGECAYSADDKVIFKSSFP